MKDCKKKMHVIWKIADTHSGVSSDFLIFNRFIGNFRQRLYFEGGYAWSVMFGRSEREIGVTSSNFNRKLLHTLTHTNLWERIESISPT